MANLTFMTNRGRRLTIGDVAIPKLTPLFVFSLFISFMDTPHLYIDKKRLRMPKHFLFSYSCLLLSSILAVQAQSVSLQVPTGHSGEVLSVAFSPDGKYALSGSRDQSIKLWELSSGKEVK